jgi:hypothetical protein
MELDQKIFKNSIPTSKKTLHFTVKKNNWLRFKEKIAVYFQNHMKHINTLCGQNAQIF